MIRLENLTKTFVLRGRRKMVAKRINAVFPTGASVALLGRNGAGKSTLLEMIAGSMEYDSGEIYSTGTISWPVGFAGAFNAEMTGAQNVRFIARVYGVDTRELTEYVEDFAELGMHFNMPVRSYSSGMKSRLAFGVSMGIQFDTYLVDEVTSVGDAAFRAKSKAVFLDRLKTSGAIVVSHQMGFVRDVCDHAAILENGKLTWYDDIRKAIKHHERIAEPPTGRNRPRLKDEGEIEAEKEFEAERAAREQAKEKRRGENQKPNRPNQPGRRAKLNFVSTRSAAPAEGENAPEETGTPPAMFRSSR